MPDEHDLIGIAELAAASGVPQATLRTWERRYGFPRPRRSPSGRRLFDRDTVEAVRRVTTLRAQGLSLEAAIALARDEVAAPGSPFVHAASVAVGVPRLVVTKRTLVAISRAIEDEIALRLRGGVVVGFFQRERFFRQSAQRWADLASAADACFAFADFRRARAGAVCELPLPSASEARRDWAIVAASGEFAVLLCGRELAAAPRLQDDRRRRFEAFWTTEIGAIKAALASARRIAHTVADGESREALAPLDEVLESGRVAPPSLAALVSLCNRMVLYAGEGLPEEIASI